MPEPRQRPARGDARVGARGGARDAGDRVVDAAVALLHERGLGVALDRIGLEEAIAASGVARATAYRRWPSREAFQQQVLLRVVHDVRPDAAGAADVAALRRLLGGRRDVLRTAAGRRTLVVEALRLVADRDVRRLTRSGARRDRLALHATCASLPAGALRDAVATALEESERASTAHRATVYALLTDVLGYRLVPWLDAATGYALLSEATGALMTGFLAHASRREEQAPRVLAAFGSTVEARWSTEAYALVATVLAYLEPDPAVVWDEARVEAALAGSYALERAARG